MFKPGPTPASVGCSCVFCLIVSVATVVLVAMNLHQYWELGWSKLAWISIIAIPIMALVCGMMSRRQACKMIEKKDEQS
jgi:hypothetical protein